MPRYQDFDKDMDIDLDNLHEEWEGQAKLTMDYVKIAARANRRFRRAEERVKTIRSMLSKKCKKSNPKATDKIVEAYYRTHPKYMEAKKDEINAEYEASMAAGALNAINFQRRAGLENEVKLLQMGYFAGPNEPKEIGGDLLKRNKQSKARAAVNKKLNKNKKRKRTK
jgi:hypothetical protein